MDTRIFIACGIIDYYAGSGADWASEEAGSLIAQSESEWWDLPCDAEGPTIEQNKMMDEFIDRLVTKIMELDNIFADNADVYIDVKEFDNCVIKYHNYVIKVWDKNQENILGSICGNNPKEDWLAILNGHNPIDEKWEDGAGNTCNINGWGN